MLFRIVVLVFIAELAVQIRATALAGSVALTLSILGVPITLEAVFVIWKSKKSWE